MRSLISLVSTAALHGQEYTSQGILKSLSAGHNSKSKNLLTTKLTSAIKDNKDNLKNAVKSSLVLLKWLLQRGSTN